jgi:hypothetical protein
MKSATIRASPGSDAAVVLGHPRHDLPPQVAVDADAVYEDDRRAVAPLAVLDRAGGYGGRPAVAQFGADRHRDNSLAGD